MHGAVTNQNTTHDARLNVWRGDGSRDRPVVLVVEDDPDAWRMYGQVLWYNGFDVIHAADAQSGYRSATSFQPNLILLDIILPDMNGAALCSRLRDEGIGVPIIALSALTRSEAGQRETVAGFTQYLEKPVDPVRVLFTVESLIGRAPPSGEGRPPSQSSAG